MRVLGIDPGYGRCGIAIVEKREGKEHWIYSECVETSPESDFTERLNQVVTSCTRAIADHTPQALAIERLYFNTNQKTVMRVAEVRGAIIQAATAAGLQTFEYTPGQIKSATTGFGKADKKQIIAMIRMLLNVTKPIKHDDEYDAIAVGVTHLAHVRSVHEGARAIN